MAEGLLPSQSRTDCPQPVFSLIGLHHRAHLRRCRQHVPWNLNMWRNIIHANDFSLWLWQSRVKVWRRNKECYAICCTDRLTAFGRSSVMVWNVISLTRGNLSAERYRDEILQPVAMPYPSLELNFILKHNNVWPHRVGFVRDYLHNFEMERIEWPACSSDLNAMEEFWDQLGCAVCSRVTNTTRLAEEWDPILQQSVYKLVTTMRKRVPDCDWVWFFYMLLRLLIVKWINC